MEGGMETEILESVGLTPGEAKVYLALLRLSESSSGPISAESGITQAKVYPILGKLAKKGMVTHIERNGVRHFQALEPGKITDYLKERRSELDELEKKFEKFLPVLEAYRKPETGQSAMIYQGLKGMKVAHEHTYLKLKRGEEYCVLGVPQYPPWEMPGGRFVRYWEKDHLRRAEAGIKCRMLFNTDAERGLLRKRNEGRLCKARYMPIDIKAPAYFTIYKNTVLITIISAEPICIEIVSGEVGDAFRSFFEEFWKRSVELR